MEKEIENLINLLPKKITRKSILILVQKIRMKLLKNFNLDNGDYDKWEKGKLEIGNLNKLSLEIKNIVENFLKKEKIKISSKKLNNLSIEITNYFLNQNLI